MTGKEFIQAVANSRVDVVSLLLSILDEAGADYCVVGGLAVNAYAEPVVSLDLDVVVVAHRLETVVTAARARGMGVLECAHSVNLSAVGSDLRVQLQTDARYQDFVVRRERRSVLGYEMWVARLADVVQGKIWAYLDPARRKSKRQKDLSDLMRLVESHPLLKDALPPAIREQVD
jgi:hypothetical protein